MGFDANRVREPRLLDGPVHLRRDRGAVKHPIGTSAARIMLAYPMPDGVSYGHMEVEFTLHARDVIAARRLDFEWITRTMKTPQLVEEAADGTRHFLARVPEQEGLNCSPKVDPPLVITAFLDRRMRGRVG